MKQLLIATLLVIGLAAFTNLREPPVSYTIILTPQQLDLLVNVLNQSTAAYTDVVRVQQVIYPQVNDQMHSFLSADSILRSKTIDSIKAKAPHRK